MGRPVSAFAISSVFPLLAACGNSGATPQPTAPTAAYGAYPSGSPAAAQGQSQPPPGYPSASYPPGYAPASPYAAPPPPVSQPPLPGPVTYTTPGAPYAPPAPATPPPAAAATGTLSTPGLLALPCQSDAICALHHCNTQYGKCAFPCQSPVDCVSNNCVMGVCLPGNGS